MKRAFLKTVNIVFIAAFVLQANLACGKRTDRSGEAFGATSHRSDWVEFNNAEFGIVYFDKTDEDKLFKLDDKGSLQYFTSDIVKRFIPSSSYKMDAGSGIAVRFIPGKISKDDFVMLRAVVTLPETVSINGNRIKEVDAAYKYDFRYSGRTEYIWFLFNEENTGMHIPGRWKISLYSGDMRVYMRDFTVSK